MTGSKGRTDLEVAFVDNESTVDVKRSKPTTSEKISKYMSKMGHSIFSKDTLKKRLPITQWAPHYNMECLQGDLLAGITVGLTVIPQGIAYAIVAGVPPNYGLYSAFMGCFVYLVFGSSKDITIGPTAIMSIMTHTYTQGLECKDDEQAMADMAVLLAFMTGLIILVATIIRIGFLITFIGRTVIIGFTSAAALTIATSQVKGLLGISIHAEGFINTWVEIFKHIDETRWQDLSLGLVCCVVLIFMKEMRRFQFSKPSENDSTGQRIFKKIFFIVSVGRNAIVVLVCCLIAYLVQESEPFTITGFIEAGFPKVGLPTFTLSCGNATLNETEFYNFGEVMSMFSTGLVIVPIIAILEDIAIASAFAQGKAIDGTQEMLALGLCNLIGSFFQSIPTTGSFSRTAVNNTSGVKTQAGGVMTGILVILALLFLTPVFQYIPKSTLSAVIICAVLAMVEYHDIVPIWKTFKLDQIPLWTTFIVCLAWKLEWGILVGAAVNVCILLYLQAKPSVTLTMKETDGGKPEECMVVVQPSLGLMFPSSEFIKSQVSAAGVQHSSLTVVLDCLHLALVDYTAVLAIKDLIKEFGSRNQKVMLANMNKTVAKSLTALITDLNDRVCDLNSLPSAVIVHRPDQHLSEGKGLIYPAA